MPRQIWTLVGCHSLEDFPIHLRGRDAQSLLSALVCGWHPQLLRATGQLPGWSRLDAPPAPSPESVLVVPTASERGLSTGLVERTAAEGGKVVRGVLERRGAAAEILRHWELPLRTPAGSDLPTVDDFFGLGYHYWQVTLLTRRLRYSAHLDESAFGAAAVAAAAAWESADAPACQAQLQSAFDMLAQERCRAFPIDPQFIDLVLVAETTLGADLLQELRADGPQSLLLSGAVVARLARENPAALAMLRQLLAAQQRELVGGCQQELPWALLDPETILAEFRRAEETYRSQLGTTPLVFGRRTAGLLATTPQLLVGLGFQAALHAGFDGEKLPQAYQSPADWTTSDGEHVPAWLGDPLDASDSSGFLGLSVAIGEALDSAHTSATVFAHWPNRGCEWLGDLRRGAKFGRVLGAWTPFHTYCRQGAFAGQRIEFEPAAYQADFLRRWQEQRLADPIGRWVGAAQCRALRAAHDWLRAMGEWSGPAGREPLAAAQISAAAAASPENENLVARESPLPAAAAVATHLQEELEHLAKQFAGQVTPPAAAAPPALLVVNPLPHTRRVLCAIPPEFGDLAENPAVIDWAATPGGAGFAVVEVPSAGFVQLAARPAGPRRHRRRPQVVDGTRLRNEFCEVAIDEGTGGIRSVTLPNRRGNLLAQQLGLRLAAPRADAARDAGAEAFYTRALVDQIETVHSDAVLGRIRTQGTLHAGTALAARFVQTVTVVRGRRIIELEIELELPTPPANDPWRQYVASRFAWSADSAALSGGVAGHHSELPHARCESPQYVAIESDGTRLAILCGGLPFHCRADFRKLDTLLVAAGDTARRFRLGLAVPTDYPARDALDFATPAPLVPVPAGRSSVQPVAWLLRVDRQNLWITGLQPIPGGLELRCCETAGRGGQAELAVARPLSRAARVNLKGEELSQLPVRDGGVVFGFRPHEYFQLRIQWQAT